MCWVRTELGRRVLQVLRALSAAQQKPIPAALLCWFSPQKSIIKDSGRKQKPGAIHRAKRDIKQSWHFCFVPSYCFKLRSRSQCRKHKGMVQGDARFHFPNLQHCTCTLYKQLHTMSCSLPNWPLDVLSGGRRPAPPLRLMLLPVCDMPASNIFCKDPCSSLTTDTSSHLGLNPSVWQSATCNSQEILKDVGWIERCFPWL